MLGVIGRNGAGKSTLLKVRRGLLPPTGGLEFAAASAACSRSAPFHPELTGRENVYLNGSVLGMKWREIARKMDAIVEFSGVEQFMDTPVKRYSSGMYVRLAFAVARARSCSSTKCCRIEGRGVPASLPGTDAGLRRLRSDGALRLTTCERCPRLCERAILLDGGRIVYEGSGGRGRALPPFRSRIGPGAGVAGHRDRPGDRFVRLRSVRVVKTGDEDGTGVRYPVGIEIGFRVLRSRRPVFRSSSS